MRPHVTDRDHKRLYTSPSLHQQALPFQELFLHSGRAQNGTCANKCDELGRGRVVPSFTPPPLASTALAPICARPESGKFYSDENAHYAGYMSHNFNISETVQTTCLVTSAEELGMKCKNNSLKGVTSKTRPPTRANLFEFFGQNSRKLTVRLLSLPKMLCENC